jgi:hypothetical protein
LQYVAAFHTSDTGRGTAVPVNTSDDPATNYERMAKIKLAGPYAQMRKFKMAARKVERHANDGQWGPDFDDSERLTQCLYICRQFGQLEERDYEFTRAQAEEIGALWQTIQIEAHKLVDDNWPAIVRVAEELMTRPLLVQDDVDRLMVESR